MLSFLRTKLRLLLAAAAAIGISGPAIAGDDMQAIIDLNVGWTTVDADHDDDVGDKDTPFLGGSARILIPGSSGWNTQLDIDGFAAFLNGDDIDENYGSSFTGTAHFSRASTDSLFGLFGLIGSANAGEDEQVTLFAAGLEAQKRLNAVTIYGQGGYFTTQTEDSDSSEDGIEDAWFVRGIWRQFPTDNSKIEIEFNYAQGNVDYHDSPDPDDDQMMAWGAKYERDYASGRPMSWYIAYIGSQTKNESISDPGEVTDHSLVLGTTFRFGAGGQKQADRNGPTLSAPWALARWSGYSLESLD